MEFPISTAPAIGGAAVVAPGILWLRMPLPYALDHVNLWLIDDQAGWVLVDTGYPDRQNRELWEAAFDGPMGRRRPSRLIVTHFHPDHMGLAGWLVERFGLTLETTLAEWAHGRMVSLDHGQAFVDASLAFYKAAGFDQGLLELAAKRGNAYAARVKDIPPVYRRIREGDELLLGGRKWKVVVGEGHAVELACLWCEELKVMISGDQILPSISPNVSVWPTEPDGDPLRRFISSLERFRALPDDILVLPSHGLPFRGLHERIGQLEGHHAERLEETLEACRTPITATELIAVLFRRKLDTHQLFFALGESLAHLHYLLGQGKVARDIDGNGVQRFRRL